MWPLIVYDQLNNIFSQNTLQDPQIYWNPSWRLKLDQLLKEIQYYTYTYLTICIWKHNTISEWTCFLLTACIFSLDNNDQVYVTLLFFLFFFSPTKQLIREVQQLTISGRFTVQLQPWRQLPSSGPHDVIAVILLTARVFCYRVTFLSHFRVN